MTGQRLLEALESLLIAVAPRQRETVAKFIAAVWLTSTLTVGDMARSAAMRFGARPRTLHKSFDRLLSRASFDPLALYRPHIASLIGTRQRVEIAIDWLSLRKDSIRVLLASMCTDDGRAWPLFALTIPTAQRKKRQREIERDMIEQLRAMIPKGIDVVVLADRGFDGVQFRADLRAAGFHYVIRVRGNLSAYVDGKKYTTRQLAATRSDGITRRKNVLLTAKKDAAGTLVTCWDEKSRGPWLLITDLADNSEAVIAAYARRFRIEECIRDMKNIRLGLGLEEVRIESTRRWTVLLALVIVGYTVLRRCGVIAQARGLARDFSTSGRRPHSHSTFSLGHFHANASYDILQEALGIAPPAEIMRAA